MKKPIIYSQDELYIMEHKLGRKIQDLTKEELEKIKNDENEQNEKK